MGENANADRWHSWPGLVLMVLRADLYSSKNPLTV